MSFMSLSLFTRLLLAQFILWTAIVAGSLALSVREANETARQIARVEGGDVFRVVLAMRQWIARHGGVLVEQDAETPPNPYLELPERDPVTVSGRRLTTLNPAYMTRQLAGEIQKTAGVSIHITSLRPLNPQNRPDAWEAEALRLFESGAAKEVSEFVERGSETLARYMAPLMTTEPCLKCHAKQGYRVGEVRGGVSVSFSAGPLLEALDRQIQTYAAAHLAAWMFVSATLLGFAAYRQRKERELAETGRLLAEDAKMAALGSMVAGVAHEVNTPLGVCVTAASMVEDAQRGLARELAGATLTQEGLQAGLDNIGQASAILGQNLQRAAKLVRSFKQIAVDQNTTEAREVDLKTFLDEILTAHHNLLKKARVAVEVDCPDNLRVTFDAGAFVQIVTNLLQNTLAHALDPGRDMRVRIAARDLDGRIELVYSDNGVGMDEETARRAFEPFYTTRRGQGGSGLGLNIVYNLATQRFKGGVALDSRPGRGATFTLHLTKDHP